MDILNAAYAQQDAYLETLESLAVLESPTRQKAAADVLASHLAVILEGDGWAVERDAQATVGDHLVARREVAGGVSSLILAHYDTVWPLGTVRAMPFRREGDRVYGPGVLDMKAGITTSLHALRLANALSLPLRGPVTLLITSDEETGSLHSRALIERLAALHDRVLVVEPGRDDGALKVGRKGTGGFFATFTGVSAHAGNNPEDGASALRELAHYLFFVEALNDDAAGTSVNLTVAQGGSVSNVIAEEASASLDLRVMTQDEAERVTDAVRGYTPRDPRVGLTLTGGLNRPPLEFTPPNKRLFEEAQGLAGAMGVGLEGAVVGGGSDGNFTSAMGIPTLDGLGSIGQGPHARHEHIRLRETLERLALLTALLTTQP